MIDLLALLDLSPWDSAIWQTPRAVRLGFVSQVPSLAPDQRGGQWHTWRAGGWLGPGTACRLPQRARTEPGSAPGQIQEIDCIVSVTCEILTFQTIPSSWISSILHHAPTCVIDTSLHLFFFLKRAYTLSSEFLEFFFIWCAAARNHCVCFSLAAYSKFSGTGYWCLDLDFSKRILSMLQHAYASTYIAT